MVAVTFDNLTNHLGLVPMMITESFAPYKQGEIAGFDPPRAEFLFGKNVAVPVGEDGRPLAVAVDVEAAAVAAPASTPTVQIPDNWTELHFLQRIRLAREIRGTDESPTKTEADRIIQAEVIRQKGTSHGDQV